MKTGILGGTFNPPHLGHLNAAKLAKNALNLDKVLFIPTNIPPHKALPENTASPEDRCEMVRLLIEHENWAKLDLIEIERGGASYTVDTLRALKKKGEDNLYLIVGTDMLMTFDKIWKEPQEILRLSALAVCARENDDWDKLEKKTMELENSFNAKIKLVKGDCVTISSTELRNGDRLDCFTNEKLADYIREKHLYGY